MLMQHAHLHVSFFKMDAVKAKKGSYTLPEVAKIAGVSLSTVRKAVAAGRLSVWYPNKHARVKAKDLEGWMKSVREND